MNLEEITLIIQDRTVVVRVTIFARLTTKQNVVKKAKYLIG